MLLLYPICSIQERTYSAFFAGLLSLGAEVADDEAFEPLVPADASVLLAGSAAELDEWPFVDDDELL